ncbi:MAG TPA: TerC family protein, partial [Devosia sp.]|nr:TerC family protein [Devosia sp.]
LLAWVCWKMWLDLQHPQEHEHSGDDCEFSGLAEGCEVARVRDFRRAVLHILLADISMSLDNVLAVAGAAREHPVVLAFGLLLSIGLMGAAANYIAALLQRHRWIAYLGLAIIAFVAFRMIFHGSQEVLVAAGILVPGHG